MESTLPRGRAATWMAITAIAPIAWGTTYVVTRHLLPTDSPLWGSALRALPAGILLILIARRLPTGSWWWRSVVLGALNIGAFFLLVYVAAQILPSSIAASVMALAPLALAGIAWPLLGQRPAARTIAGAILGIVGVTLVVGLSAGAVDGWGVAASLTALLLSSLGAILTQRWRRGTPLIALTAWQLLAGGGMLLIAAIVIEGSPPALGPTGITAIAFVSIVATGIAFLCWFNGLARLPAGTVGVIGLLNPVTGVLLGTLVASESLTVAQAFGIALVLIAILSTQRFTRRASALTRARPVSPSPSPSDQPT